MKKATILIILTFSLSSSFGQNLPYEITAYEGTVFNCGVRSSHTYPSTCSGIILSNDTTILNINNESDFYKSLFKHAKYERYGFFELANALMILFPGKENLLSNCDNATKLYEDFDEMLSKRSNTFYCRLYNGKEANISYYWVKGIFLSIYDPEFRSHFTTSNDVPEEDLPNFDSTVIPIVIFECKDSNHKFIIQE